MARTAEAWTASRPRFATGSAGASPRRRTGTLVEQARDRLLACRARDRLADQRRDRRHADVRCGQHRLGRLDRVGDDQFLDARGGDPGDGSAGQHAMGDVGRTEAAPASISASAALQSVPPESTMSSNRMQRRPETSPMMFITSASPGRSRRLSTMASGASMRLASARARTTPPTSGETTMTLRRSWWALMSRAHHRHREEVVGRDVEEALDLPGVKVERQHAVGAGLGDQVGDQLCRDRRAAGGAPVLPGVAEIRQHGGDPAGRRAPRRHP